MTRSDDSPDTARQVAQRLQDLRRAGLDRVPRTRRQSARAQPAAEPEAEPAGAPRRAAHRAEKTAGPAEATPATPVPTAAPARPKADVDASPLFGGEGLAGESLDPAERAEKLRVLAEAVSTCPRCAELAATRTHTVFGEGSPTARLMFIGEAPGQTEDETGRPFVGRAGQLLTDMITKGMGLRREDVYIANTLKCRPPGNRDPLPEEQRNCFGYLERQIELIRPEFLCLLGKPAVAAVLGTALPMKAVRGRWHRFRDIPTIVTWHPAYLLRNPAAKKDTWADLQMLMKAMGLAPPGK
jgi:DNA polymerase